MHNDNMHQRRFATLYRIRCDVLLLLPFFLLLFIYFFLHLLVTQKRCEIMIIIIITMKMRLFIKLSVVLLYSMLFCFFFFFFSFISLTERHIFNNIHRDSVSHIDLNTYKHKHKCSGLWRSSWCNYWQTWFDAVVNKIIKSHCTCMLHEIIRKFNKLERNLDWEVNKK